MIEHLQTGQADFSVSPTVDVSTRRHVVDFTLPVAGLTYNAIYRRPSITTNDFAHLQPFEPALWLTLMVWIVCMTAVLLALAHGISSAWRRRHMLQTWRENMATCMGDWVLYAAGSLTGQSYVFTPQLLRNEIFAFEWLLFTVAAASFILNAAYSGVLFSFLSLRQGSGNFYHLASKSYKFAVMDDIRFPLDKRVEVSGTCSVFMRYLR